MVFVTFHYAYWQHKHPNGDVFDMRYDTDHMMVRIYRFSGIPTQQMIDDNVTTWSNEWRNGSFSKTEFYLHDNDLPVRARAPPRARARGSARPRAAGQLRLARRELLRHLVLLPPL